MAGNIKGITIEIGGNTTKLESALKNVNGSIKETKSQLKDVEKLLKMDPGNTELLKQKQDLLSKAIEETKEKLETEKEALRQLEQAGNPETIEQQKRLKREIEATKQELNGLKKTSDEFGGVFTAKLKAASDSVREFGGKVKDAGESIKGAGNKMMPLTAAIVGAGTASGAMAMNFEDSMAKVSTIADTTKVPLEELQQQILELSNETGLAASDIAENVYNAISAGQETGDAVNFVANATKLAKAGFADSAAATDILTTALNAYGLEAEQVGHVSDVLITTQNLGKTTVGELASAMGKIIPTAKAQNVSIEELCAGYAVMTSNGIATAETTTYMNSMLNELGKTGSSAQKALAAATGDIKKGGLSMAEAMEQCGGLTGVLQVLNDYAERSGTTIANMFGSAEAGKAATVLSDNVAKLGDSFASMTESAGATDEAYAKLNTNSLRMQQTINRLKNSMIDIGGNILDVLAPAFEAVSNKVSEFSNWLSNLDERTKNIIVIIGMVVAAIGPVLVFIGTLVSSIGAIITAVSFLISPIGIVVAAIVSVIAFIVLLSAHMDELKAEINDYATFLVSFFTQLVSTVQTWMDNLITKIKTKMTEIFNAFKETFDDIISSAKEWGKDIISNLIDGIKSMIDKVKDVAGAVADTIASFLHFSEPDVGPLSNFHTFMPDMMDLLAKGIENNMSVLNAPMQGLASALVPDYSSALGTSNAYLSQIANREPAAPNVTVKIEGEMSRLFRMVQSESRSFHKLTGRGATT